MSEKEASSVLTSENAADFYAQKLGLATETTTEAVETTPEPVVEEPQSEPEAESEAKPVEEAEKKPNPKLEKRFSELTKQRELARQEAERERQRAIELEKRLEALEKKAPEKVFDPDAEPQPSQFNDAFEYAKALAEYSTEKALQNRDREEAEKAKAAERQKVIEAWQSRLEATKQELTDYDDMIASSDVVVNDQIRDAILESDAGPRILYHLAENPDVAEKLNKLTVVSALRELGKIEARFEKTETPAKTAVSKAPAPITPLKAVGSVPENKVTSDGQFVGTYQEWKQQRQAGKIK